MVSVLKELSLVRELSKDMSAEQGGECLGGVSTGCLMWGEGRGRGIATEDFLEEVISGCFKEYGTVSNERRASSQRGDVRTGTEVRTRPVSGALQGWGCQS